MVPDPLNRRLSDVLKIIGRYPGALLSALAAGALTLVLVTWLGGEQGERSHAGDRPSLLELLDQVSKERGRQLEDAPLDTAPQAPRARSWTSPLARQCSGIDPAVKQRLETLMSQEASWRSDLAIDATNFGRRHERDAFGRRLDITPRVVVMHETVYSMTSAVNTFLTPHPRDEDQVSYCLLYTSDAADE